MTSAQFIGQNLALPAQQINRVLVLLQADATVPFIARYRKELTGNLDEVRLYQIQKLKKQFDELQKRQQTIVKALTEQKILTADLEQKILNTFEATALEDLYLPYKKKRKTKAEKARQTGLEPLAKIIMAQRAKDIFLTAANFVNESVKTPEEALEGARHIMAEWINETIWVRHIVRRLYRQSALIKTKVVKAEEHNEKAQKYLDYFDWQETLRRTPSHRLLALLRAEKEGFIRIKLEVDTDFLLQKLGDRLIKNNDETAGQIVLAVKDAYKRLLAPSISAETLNFYKEKADVTAIKVFSNNLRQLLLAAPLGEKRVLALDPGFRSGCKLVCLDRQGNLIHDMVIYPHPPQNKLKEAEEHLKYLVEKFDMEAIGIGNGTASRETENLVRQINFHKSLPIFVVSESGASIYSASPLAGAEFPDKDVTVRGAVSIGRRLQDPLAELVKIDPKSIGVGQYQYEVNQTLLKQELDATVESAVNLVGVNVNTASPHLLRYVSGIGEKLAENIVKYRTEHGHFPDRAHLKKVKGLGAKAFEQCAGFLRIKNGSNPLDDSAVHPESYPVVAQIAKRLSVDIKTLIGQKKLLQQIDLQRFVNDNVGLPTLKDILKALEKPGLDVRKKATVFAFSPDLKNIADVKEGAVYPGLINNITNFGCFVNIGIKESGLVHISNMSDQFVSNPADIVQLNQQVQVKVIHLDLSRKRIGLSLVF